MKIGKKGFTLVELVIVIVIVGILSIVSVPIYRGYVEKAMMTEGKVLLGAIGKAELAYHVQKGYFFNFSGGSMCEELDIDADANKYFKRFKMQSGSSGSSPEYVSAVVSYAGRDDYDNEYVDIWVYGSHRSTAWELHAKQWANGSLHGDNDDIDVSPWIQK